MKKILSLLTFVFVIFSCTNNDKVLASLVKEKVDTMSGHEVVRDLLIENEGDEEQLARIFKCSVPTIKRIKNKETYLTENALSEFRNLLVGVKVSGKDTFKENDPYYDSNIRSLKYWLNSKFWIVLIITVFYIIIMITYRDNGLEGDGFIPLYLFVILYILVYVLNWVFPYKQPSNLFLEKINPIIETFL